jgi:hypothetical protein
VIGQHASDLGVGFERRQPGAGGLERLIGSDQDALTTAVEQRDVPKLAVQRANDRRKIARVDVVQLHPLLEDPARSQALADQAVKFATV